MRHDTWTGGDHYWIRFHNGTHEVRRELPEEYYDDNETVFTGHYGECVEWINNKVVENYEFDHGL